MDKRYKDFSADGIFQLQSELEELRSKKDINFVENDIPALANELLLKLDPRE